MIAIGNVQRPPHFLKDLLLRGWRPKNNQFSCTVSVNHWERLAHQHDSARICKNIVLLRLLCIESIQCSCLQVFWLRARNKQWTHLSYLVMPKPATLFYSTTANLKPPANPQNQKKWCALQRVQNGSHISFCATPCALVGETDGMQSAYKNCLDWKAMLILRSFAVDQVFSKKRLISLHWQAYLTWSSEHWHQKQALAGAKAVYSETSLCKQTCAKEP